jgi:MoaA/NifB/PqqE/SkfB family radical SAM enzyme
MKGESVQALPTTLDRIRWMARLARGLGLAGAGFRPVPLFASLEVTLRCDGSCAYCASSRMAGAGDLPTREWIAIIDRLARAGTVSASLTGGEPLLRPDLPELAARCRKHRIRVELNTNGRLLASRWYMLDLVDAITVSLDGARDVQDRIRGAGSFDAALTAVELARSRGVPVSATAVMSPEALEGLDAFLELLVRLRLPARFQPVYPVLLRSRDIPTPSVPDPARFREGIQRLRRARAAGVPVMNSRASLDYLHGLPDGGKIMCGGGRYFVRVTAAGAAEVCGLDRDPSPAGLDALNDLPRALAMLEKAACSPCHGCLSAGRLEVNLALGGSRSALATLFARRSR